MLMRYVPVLMRHSLRLVVMIDAQMSLKYQKLFLSFDDTIVLHEEIMV